MAGQINSFIDKNAVEKEQTTAPMVHAVAAAAQTIKSLGRMLGLFRSTAVVPAPVPDQLVGKLVELLMQLRQEARESKNFTVADTIRKRLLDMGITLEDRPGGTEWRREA